MENYTKLNLTELQEAYVVMAESYKQEIHELKRHLETANAAQAYLAVELEQMTNSAQPEPKVNDKMKLEFDNLRHEHNELRTEHTALQQEHETLYEERSTLCARLQAAEAKLDMEKCKESNDVLSSYNERIEKLEQENLDLMQKLNEMQEKDMHSARNQVHMQATIETLQDQVQCLEQNLQSKREALDEKSLLLESTQEQLADVNAKLAMLSTTPNDTERKGNSLFAEVDDQRQVMKHLLDSQKKSYMEMKTIYDGREHELRRLKRENAAMHTELQACLSIFCNADKMYQEKLNERIRNLTHQNEDLEKKLKWTQERLRDVADTKGVAWLETMFNFCKKETEDLKLQIHSSCIQKASLEEHLRNVQQEMSRWRFEALKLRCITLNRENILNEHKIPFEPSQTVRYRITEKDLSVAKPNIGDTTNNDTNQNPISDTNKDPINESNNDLISDTNKDPMNDSNNDSTANDVFKNQVELKPIRLQKPTTTSAASASNTPPPLRVGVHTAVKEEMEENKENINVDQQQEIENKNALPECNVKREGAKVLPGSSILCKQRDILSAEENTKTVRFSDKPINIPIAEYKSSPEEHVKQVPLTTVQRTKSNIVVRRIVVNPKTSI